MDARGMKEQYFLEYNRDNIFKDLIQAETHFRNLKDSANFKEGHANCIVKLI